MVRKLALWVCPQIGCPKLASKPQDCPVHNKPFVRRVYVEDDLLGSRGEMGDVLSKLFGKSA